MTVVHLGLGSNLGNREKNLQMAIRAFTRLARVADVSALYETEPVGPPQPAFYNAAASIETGLQPRPLLRFLRGIEEEIGRRPGGAPNGPRPIDIDILLFGESVIDELGLVVPHPRLSERPFVLVPLAEIAADVTDPVSGRTIADMLRDTGNAGTTKIADRGWDGVAGRPPDPVRI